MNIQIPVVVPSASEDCRNRPKVVGLEYYFKIKNIDQSE